MELKEVALREVQNGETYLLVDNYASRIDLIRIGQRDVYYSEGNVKELIKGCSIDIKNEVYNRDFNKVYITTNHLTFYKPFTELIYWLNRCIQHDCWLPLYKVFEEAAISLSASEIIKELLSLVKPKNLSTNCSIQAVEAEVLLKEKLENLKNAQYGIDISDVVSRDLRGIKEELITEWMMKDNRHQPINKWGVIGGPLPIGKVPSNNKLVTNLKPNSDEQKQQKQSGKSVKIDDNVPTITRGSGPKGNGVSGRTGEASIKSGHIRNRASIIKC